ncbi:DUF1778 domain-containing protein [Derxia gummosa]|uniref:DUF1778 domain-containing protein n=1 Tax=Derxia gummosa DSM 723 TaxID=1121388 RepID=A0A8B6XC62_9BURK|nr:DUF1778 domain-containing protein [Derxia gummosa]
MEHLEVRLSVEQRSLLRRAAELSDCSLGEFVVAAACDAAERVIAARFLVAEPAAMSRQHEDALQDLTDLSQDLNLGY